MKKIICGIVVVIIVLIIVILVSLPNNKVDFATEDEVNVTKHIKDDSDTIGTEKSQIMSFFQKHRSELDEIKNFFYSDKYSVKSIKNDGNIVLKDKSIKWVPKISNRIKKIFDDGAAYNIFHMDYGKHSETIGLGFTVEFYYSENRISAGLVYSQKDLTQISDIYSSLDDGWYLFSVGMT